MGEIMNDRRKILNSCFVFGKVSDFHEFFWISMIFSNIFVRKKPNRILERNFTCKYYQAAKTNEENGIFFCVPSNVIFKILLIIGFRLFDFPYAYVYENYYHFQKSIRDFVHSLKLKVTVTVQAI